VKQLDDREDWPDLDGDLETAEVTQEISKALLRRPWVSLRFQMVVGYLAPFLLAAVIAGAIIVSIYRVEERVRFLEIVHDFVLDVEEARRFEKNYFLYGTDLDEALDSTYRARSMVEERRSEVIRVVGAEEWQRIVDNISDYQSLLEHLSDLERTQGGPANGDHAMAGQLREQGQRMVFLAQDLMSKEKTALGADIASSRRIQTYSLVFMLILMITTALIISGSILRSIERFEAYAGRIADGDFTRITPTRRYRDEFTNLAVAINDMMSKLQKHEAMLIQAHKLRAIGTLTAGVAHELNNPLNNITLTAHMLLEDYETLEEDERRDMVGDVATEADRAKKIVANLLDFTRESETRLERANLVDLVHQTIGLATNQARIAGVKVELVAMDDPPTILCDKQQLTQVFLNLLLNAIAASERGGRIQILVHAADDPDHLSVKVVDYGSGIPEHILSRIWDPFFTTKAQGKGTGLGLSVSQGIVAKHGGRMTVSSKFGRGSTFTVVLPVAPLV